MIIRIWHGWTTPENADAYEDLLNETIVPGIMAKGIPGLDGLDILVRTDGDEGEVEFITAMTFSDWSAVEAFAGVGRTGSVVPPAARAVLKRFDEHSQHYEVVAHHDPAEAD
jgi:hypothetical protein